MRAFKLAEKAKKTQNLKFKKKKSSPNLSFVFYFEVQSEKLKIRFVNLSFSLSENLHKKRENEKIARPNGIT